MKKYYAAALAALSFACTAISAVADEGEEQSGHFYFGGSTGYLKPDGDRQGGNTRTLGAQAGYQFNDRWSAELGFQMDILGPGKDDLEMYDLQFVRHWGDDIRFLMEFGYTHITLDSGGPDDATAGFHIGTGVSAFITDNLELRGDVKLVDTRNGGLLDGMGTLSLNYHLGRAHAVRTEAEPVLGSSSSGDQSLPPMQYRESVEAEEPAAVVAEEPVAEVLAEQPVASSPPVVSEVQPEPAVVAPPAVVTPPQPATIVAAPTGPAKSTHTLLNFNPNSIDVGVAYGAQLDQISNEIITTNSRAVVEGHTDNQGSPIYNKVLSADRAIVVKRELKKRGVNGDDLSIVGYGEERPVATNETEEGRTQNRRVEVKLYDK